MNVNGLTDMKDILPEALTCGRQVGENGYFLDDLRKIRGKRDVRKDLPSDIIFASQLCDGFGRLGDAAVDHPQTEVYVDVGEERSGSEGIVELREEAVRLLVLVLEIVDYEFQEFRRERCHAVGQACGDDGWRQKARAMWEAFAPVSPTRRRRRRRRRAAAWVPIIASED